jgi:hypothetical protein
VSRDPRADEPEWQAAWALERIADTLDDYMDMSLSAIEITNAAKASLDPETMAVLRPLLDVLADIRARRAAR